MDLWAKIGDKYGLIYFDQFFPKNRPAAMDQDPVYPLGEVSDIKTAIHCTGVSLVYPVLAALAVDEGKAINDFGTVYLDKVTTGVGENFQVNSHGVEHHCQCFEGL